MLRCSALDRTACNCETVCRELAGNSERLKREGEREICSILNMLTFLCSGFTLSWHVNLTNQTLNFSHITPPFHIFVTFTVSRNRAAQFLWHNVHSYRAVETSIMSCLYALIIIQLRRQQNIYCGGS